MGDFVRDLKFLCGRGGVAAADDGRGAVGRSFGDRGGHGFSGAGKFFEFKHTSRSVPDDGLGAEDGLTVELDRLGTSVEATPAVRNAGREIRGHRIGVRREGVGADKVDREDQLDIARGSFGDEFFDDLRTFGVVEAGANRGAAEDFVERVSHAAADDNFVGFLEEVFDEGDFIGDLGATKNGEQRAVRMIEDFGEGFEFGFHEETGGFEREGDADHGTVRAVGGAEGVVDEDVTELGEGGAKGGDGGRIGFLGGTVLKLHFAFFFDVEAEIFEENDGAGREFSASSFDRGADAVIEESNGAAEKFFEFGSDGLEGKLGDLLAVGTTEVRHEDDRSAFFQSELDRWNRGGDASGVGDGAGDLVLGDVEVDAHEYALAREGEVADGLKIGHGRKS